MATPRRLNGLSPPYSGAQVSAWMALLFTLIQFPIVVSPLMPLAASIPVSLVFGALVALSFYYGFMTQLVDPMDVHLAHSLQQLQGGQEKKSSCLGKLYDKVNNFPSDLPSEEMKQCWICDVQVAEHAMHCKFCNKCIGHFDHHCMWLNTCVGRGNYHYFFRTMIYLLLMEAMHLIVQVALLIDSFTDGATRDRVWFNIYATQTLLIFFACFNILSLLLIGQLLAFHMNLQRQQLTTYQFIVRDHKRRREQGRLLLELENRRTVQMGKANDEGKNLRGLQLRCGRYGRRFGCPLFDPLELLKPEAEPDPDPEAGFASSLGASAPPANLDDSWERSTDRPALDGPGERFEINRDGITFLDMKDMHDEVPEDKDDDNDEQGQLPPSKLNTTSPAADNTTDDTDKLLSLELAQTSADSDTAPLKEADESSSIVSDSHICDGNGTQQTDEDVHAMAEADGR